MNDEIRAMSDFDGKLLGKVMAFTDGESGDVVYERVVMVEVVDGEAGEIELAFDMLNPKRRVYIRFKQDDLAIVLSEVMP